MLRRVHFIFVLPLLLSASFAEEMSRSASAEAEKEVTKREQKQPATSSTKGPRPDVAFCEGTLSAFFVSDNVEVRGANATALIEGVSEKQCIEYCAQNRDNRGRSLLCGSALYESDSKHCKIFRRASLPDGEMQRQAMKVNMRYFEKFCLADDLPSECANKQFVRVDDYILKGYAQSTNNVGSMAECAAYCMREREFECKSAMYFYEEGECITNVESAITAPDDFQKPEDDDKVVFFHNGCLQQSANGAIKFELAEQEDSTTAAVPNEQSTEAQDAKGSQKRSALNETKGTEAPQADGGEPAEGSSTSPAPKVPSATEEASSSVATEATTAAEEEGVEEGQKLEESVEPAAATGTGDAPEAKAPAEPQARIHPKQTLNSAAHTLQYGAKPIERTPDGFFQEKVVAAASPAAVAERFFQEKVVAAASPAAVAEQPKDAAGNSVVVRAAAANRKGESTKRLHLKLIKDQQQQQQKPGAPVAAAPVDNIVAAPSAPNLQQSSPTVPPSSPPPTPSASSTPTPYERQFPSQEQPNSALQYSLEEQFEGTEGYFSRWGSWTPCSVPGERRVRRRKCLDLRRCKGALMQVDYCPRDIPAAEEQREVAAAEAQQAPLLVPQQPIQVVQLQPQGPPASAQQESASPTSSRTPVAIDLANGIRVDNGDAQPPAIQPSEPLPAAGAPAPKPAPQGEDANIWSPWSGQCQNFASSQPCKDGQVIGFEARECVATNPLACKGPFFRYCTLPC